MRTFLSITVRVFISNNTMVSAQLIKQLQLNFPKVHVMDSDDSVYIGSVLEGSEVGPVLSFLMTKDQKIVTLDTCTPQDYHLLFQFEEIWYSQDWSSDLGKMIRSTKSTYPNVKTIKINNIRFILKKRDVPKLKKVFPNLERVQYTDNGSDELELAEHPEWVPNMTNSEIKELLGNLADPFGW